MKIREVKDDDGEDCYEAELSGTDALLILLIVVLVVIGFTVALVG